ncbi:hypothetical protein Nepgr_026230 [Nepenthes gracilis]|uniref:Uncharacterized protein n=1 Tax=Nepenthes gracilis TaxID=150966 RepID=A0AAD3Y075_NEPGR|nr:hypothetical protein Nepgr_026230 [Nepenthes gracilis]
MEIGHYEKAAESYEQIFQLVPDNLDALQIATMLYKKCSQFEHFVNILLGCLKDHPHETELSMVDMLASLYMENNMHVEALRHIENAKRCGRELPLFLTKSVNLAMLIMVI